MLIGDLSWPQAMVESVAILSLALVVCVAIWQVFRTGQTAIKKESGRHDDLRKDVDELKGLVERPAA
jgi:ABC-type nickel/cobalt efflux system permease component RcnA